MKKQKHTAAPEGQSSVRPQKRKLPLRWRILLVLAVLIVPGLNHSFKIVNYTIDAAEITAPVRIALVSDFHSCYAGKRAEKLFDAIDAQSPDLIVMTGDIFDEIQPDERTEHLLQGISGKYPCYYVTGNHEYMSDTFDEEMAILEKYHIKRLSGTAEALTVNGQSVTLCGIDDPDEPSCWYTDQLDAVKAQSEEMGGYSILLAHRPELAEEYASYGFAMALCGHAHGGQWRLPGVLNGLYAPDQGFFPAYAGGYYSIADTDVIISRGLTTKSPPVPRIYNRPELVIIDLQ